MSAEVRRRLVGSFLLEARQRRGLRQSDLARELGYTSAQFVSNWERGISLPPEDALVKLSELLRLSRRALIDRMIRCELEVLKARRRALGRTLGITR